MSAPCAVLFDLDGTLVDSNELHVQSWLEVFRAAGLAADEAAVRQHIGMGGDNLVPAIFPHLAPSERERLPQDHGELFKRVYIDRVDAFPRARDLLIAVREGGCSIVLASSASQEEVSHYCTLLDAEALVDAITSKDDVAHSKPNPDIFQAALERAGVTGDRAIVVGDTPYDAIAAARCGIATIGLLSGGFAGQQLRDAGAGEIYRDAADLLARYDSSALAHLAQPA
jgi:membrane protein